MLALRERGRYGLCFIDGHADFCYARDPKRRGRYTAAGLDLPCDRQRLRRVDESPGKKTGRARADEIDTVGNCNYSDYMTATLRETKAKLSEMVRLASQGEEVVITVHGKKVAKLVGFPKQAKKLDKKKWLAELAQLRKKYSTGRVTMTAQEIQDEDRADRV